MKTDFFFMKKSNFFAKKILNKHTLIFYFLLQKYVLQLYICLVCLELRLLVSCIKFSSWLLGNKYHCIISIKKKKSLYNTWGYNILHLHLLTLGFRLSQVQYNAFLRLIVPQELVS